MERVLDCSFACGEEGRWNVNISAQISDVLYAAYTSQYTLLHGLDAAKGARESFDAVQWESEVSLLTDVWIPISIRG